jgi:hypothetical protein
VKWTLSVDPNSWVQTAPTLVDLDGDSHLDFVVATEKSDSNRLYAYKGSDHSLLWKHTVGDWIYHGTAVSDLDGDGKPELVLGSYDGKVYCLNGEDGSTHWTYTYSTNWWYYVGAPAAIADLNDDGKCEVVFVNYDVVGALSDTGSLLWHYDIPDYATAFRGVAIADINGDNKLDVVFGTSAGKVIALNGYNGSLIWNLDLAAQYGDTLEIDHAPLIADFDNNDTLDVFIQGGKTRYPNWQGNYGRAYMFTAGLGSGPPWLMFQHDIRRQSSLCAAFTDVPENGPGRKEGFKLYPNPTDHDISIDFDVDIKNPGDLKMDIFDIYGKKIKTVPIEFSGQNIDINDLSQGVYLFRIFQNGKIFYYNKFVKM